MPATSVVYGDVVFLINFIMDYLVLWATARFGQFKTASGRLAMAALLGATYSLLVLWPDLHFLVSLVARVGFSVIMILVAYRLAGFRNFLAAFVYFYLVAFAMGGAMLGAIYFFQSYSSSSVLVDGLLTFLGHVPYLWLVAAASAAFLLARWGAMFIRRNFLRSFFQVPVIIRMGEKSLPLKALVDTGNQLRDPLTHKPVMIAEYQALKPFFPEAMCRVLEVKGGVNLTELTSSLAGSPWAMRLHMIPFTSIGKARGLLIGFRPDEVVIVADDRPVKIKDIIVGIYQEQLSPEGTYRALLHPDIFQVAM
ncbi:MAG: sigma-E processing peptidase SpoIIGA [Clostridia bacterium]|nr:MAG: sigma-E processing peptidase SpoIIGA [Clostridia bacterium]